MNSKCCKELFGVQGYFSIGLVYLAVFFQITEASGQALSQTIINKIPVNQSGSLNLGNTSFFDGFGGTDPGLVYHGYWIAQNANSIKDGNGNDVVVPTNPHINILAWANQFILTTPVTIGAARLGFSGIIPVVSTHATSDPFPPPFPPGKMLSDSAAGLGDLVFGPFLQFSPVIDNRGTPIFSQRIEIDLISPTGRYNSKNDVQPGSNFIAINPFWALTWLPTSKWEISTRLQYVFNFKNSVPADVPPSVFNTQAGQALFANFATSYEVISQVHIGLNGYYIKQITQSKVNDVAQDNSKREKLGLGPGAFWEYSKTERFFLSYYVESDVRNGPKSNVGVLRWIHLF
jgi:hypothetical protein